MITRVANLIRNYWDSAVRKFQRRYLYLRMSCSTRRFVIAVSITALSVAAFAGYVVGNYIAQRSDFPDWQAQVIDEYRQMTHTGHDELNVMTRRLALLEARLVRLDILGEQLSLQNDLDADEFNFSESPGIGGLTDSEADYSAGAWHVNSVLDRLESDLSETDMQIKILADMIEASGLREQMSPIGWPTDKGWVSSRFGYRISPFTGRREFHRGLDLAGRSGNRIIAIAGGVVKRSRHFSDYGNLVEIDHGNGYMTRYAHNQINLVQEGEAVKQGDVIALMGNTGRSTGPHLHFEVIKEGRRIDPAAYLSRR